ncbi:hypothetical protein Mapa_016845 [Marchantia paleacea]|nr:hypothetical protein Mapa_016845 [Marchantia paleacea]
MMRPITGTYRTGPHLSNANINSGPSNHLMKTGPAMSGGRGRCSERTSERARERERERERDGPAPALPGLPACVLPVFWRMCLLSNSLLERIVNQEPSIDNSSNRYLQTVRRKND